MGASGFLGIPMGWVQLTDGLQVPQMATTSAVLSSPVLRALSAAHPALSLPVLVPNAVGLKALLALIETLPSPPPTSEIAIFVAASESFSRANLNCSIRESIDRLAPVVEQAKANGIKVRGYVSVVAGCPFEGRIDPAMVTSVTKELADMGCYEVSLGDTIGVGTPATWTTLLEQLGKSMDVAKLAVRSPSLSRCEARTRPLTRSPDRRRRIATTPTARPSPRSSPASRTGSPPSTHPSLASAAAPTRPARRATSRPRTSSTRSSRPASRPASSRPRTARRTTCLWMAVRGASRLSAWPRSASGSVDRLAGRTRAGRGRPRWRGRGGPGISQRRRSCKYHDAILPQLSRPLQSCG